MKTEREVQVGNVNTDEYGNYSGRDHGKNAPRKGKRWQEASKR